MKRLCKHEGAKIIDWIKEPRYHDDSVLIRTTAIGESPHYLIKFTACNKYPDWFYMSRNNILRGTKQVNGRGEVYAVKMNQREEFEPITNCIHKEK